MDGRDRMEGSSSSHHRSTRAVAREDRDRRSKSNHHVQDNIDAGPTDAMTARSSSSYSNSQPSSSRGGATVQEDFAVSSLRSTNVESRPASRASSIGRDGDREPGRGTAQAGWEEKSSRAPVRHQVRLRFLSRFPFFATVCGFFGRCWSGTRTRFATIVSTMNMNSLHLPSLSFPHLSLPFFPLRPGRCGH